MTNWKRRLALGAVLLASVCVQADDEWATPDDRRQQVLRLLQKLNKGKPSPSKVSYELAFHPQDEKPASQPPGAAIPRAGEKSGSEAAAPQTPQPPAKGMLGDLPREIGRGAIQQIGPDQFILTGTPEEVEALARILERLDLLSGLAESDVSIVQLQHAESNQLAKLMTALYTAKQQVRGGATGGAAGGTQQGTVGFVPIAQPNALVVVARKVDLDDIVKQVKELDVGSKTGEQFRVFGLKLANATQVAGKLTTFFTDRAAAATSTGATGAAAASGAAFLRMRVEVVADERSNSILIYAGPVDMEQAAKLIELFDGGANLSVNDIRYVPLKNSPATDVATLLQQSVLARANAAAGSATATGAAQPTPFQPGGFNQQQPAAGATTGTSATVKSSRLRLLRRKTDGSGDDYMESGILEDITVTPDTRTNSLLITAPKDVMSLVVQLVQQIDAMPNAEAELKVFPLVNAAASDMLNTLQQFFGAGTTGQGGVNQGFNQGGFNQFGGQNQTGVQPRTFAVPGGTSQLSLTPLTLSVDTRTNSLLATGSPNDLLVLEGVVYKLDGNNARERKNFVYRLNTIPAADAATAIENFIQSQAGGLTGAANALGAAGQAGIQTLQQQIAQDVVVVAEEYTNQLIISASPRYFDEVLKMIQIIDRRRPQVLIQCLIAEVTLANREEWGVELGLQSSALFDRSVVTDNVLTPGINFNNINPLGNSTTRSSIVGLQGLSNFSLGRGSEDGFGGLVFSASSENVSVLMRALHRQQRLDVLTRPQIAVLDSRPARLVIGQRIPLITGTSTSQFGTIQNQFNYEDVGIILDVSAVIGPDGVIVMTVSPQVSSLAEGTGIPTAVDATGRVVGTSPIINQTALETTIVAVDGQTSVVGGLITRNRTQDVRKVPVLGDIPVLGNLFRTDFYNVEKRELLVVLTPRIVYSDADVECVKAEETRRIDWCLPDVHAVHGDPFDPGVPSFHGNDRLSAVAGMEIPEKSRLPHPTEPPRPVWGDSGAAMEAPMVSNQVPMTPESTTAQPNVGGNQPTPSPMPNMGPPPPTNPQAPQPPIRQLPTPTGNAAPKAPMTTSASQAPRGFVPAMTGMVEPKPTTPATKQGGSKRFVHLLSRRPEPALVLPPANVAPATAPLLSPSMAPR